MLTQYEGMTTGSCPPNQQKMCNITPKTSASAPGTPQNLSVTASSGQLEVSWDAPAATDDGLHLYRIQYWETSDKPGTLKEVLVGGLTTSATITGLTNGTGYSVAVRAEGADNDSAYTTAVTGTPN